MSHPDLSDSKSGPYDITRNGIGRTPRMGRRTGTLVKDYSFKEVKTLTSNDRTPKIGRVVRRSESLRRPSNSSQSKCVSEQTTGPILHGSPLNRRLNYSQNTNATQFMQDMTRKFEDNIATGQKSQSSCGFAGAFLKAKPRGDLLGEMETTPICRPNYEGMVALNSLKFKTDHKILGGGEVGRREGMPENEPSTPTLKQNIQNNDQIQAQYYDTFFKEALKDETDTVKSNDRRSQDQAADLPYDQLSSERDRERTKARRTPSTLKKMERIETQPEIYEGLIRNLTQESGNSLSFSNFTLDHHGQGTSMHQVNLDVDSRSRMSEKEREKEKPTALKQTLSKFQKPINRRMSILAKGGSNSNYAKIDACTSKGEDDRMTTNSNFCSGRSVTSLKSSKSFSIKSPLNINCGKKDKSQATLRNKTINKVSKELAETDLLYRTMSDQRKDKLERIASPPTTRPPVHSPLNRNITRSLIGKANIRVSEASQSTYTSMSNWEEDFMNTNVHSHAQNRGNPEIPIKRRTANSENNPQQDPLYRYTSDITYVSNNLTPNLSIPRLTSNSSTQNHNPRRNTQSAIEFDSMLEISHAENNEPERDLISEIHNLAVETNFDDISCVAPSTRPISPIGDLGSTIKQMPQIAEQYSPRTRSLISSKSLKKKQNIESMNAKYEQDMQRVSEGFDYHSDSETLKTDYQSRYSVMPMVNPLSVGGLKYEESLRKDLLEIQQMGSFQEVFNPICEFSPEISATIGHNKSLREKRDLIGPDINFNKDNDPNKLTIRKREHEPVILQPIKQQSGSGPSKNLTTGQEFREKVVTPRAQETIIQDGLRITHV